MLQGPSEIFEIEDGVTVDLSISSWVIDQAVIRPAHAPQGKVIEVLRVFVPTSAKAHFPYYWDITATTLIAQLRPWLEKPGFETKKFRVTAHGAGVQKRFALEVV
jgi:hypothetical protein